MRAVSRASFSSVAVVALVVGGSREARADNVEVCVAAVTSGQKLEREGQLRAARETFLTCDTSECPAEVRSVCDRLVNTVEASIPTVIFGARDSAANDLVDVRVRVDGGPVAESMDGKAVPMDPGPHRLRFEREGSAPIEQNVVIREAERNRSLIVTFPSARSGVTRSPTDEGGPRRPIPAIVFVFLGAGVASLGVFAGLDVDGQTRYDSCHATGCPASLGAERDATYAVAGLGVVALGAATWLFLARPAEPRPATALTFDIDRLRGGGVLRAQGTF